MARSKPWWMSEAPEKAPRPVVFAVLPWRGDGVYRIAQAVRVFKREHAARTFADKDETGTLVVRTLDAPPTPAVP